MPLMKPLGAALGAAAELLVERLGRVDVLGGAHPVGEGGDRGDRALAQHQVVVDELLEGAQVDRVVVLLGDVQAEDVDVELAGRGEVGDDQFHVGAAQDVRGRDGRGGDRVGSSLVMMGSLLREELMGRRSSGLGAEGGGVDVAEGDVHGLLVGVEVDRAVAALVAEARRP